MDQTGANPALRAKIEAARGGGASVLRVLGLDQALTRAIRQAGAPFDGLQPEVSVAEPVWDIDLDAVIEAFAAPALISVVEASPGARGLCLLESAVVDALIEVQTTGRVDEAPSVSRPITALDAALSRDFIGLLIAGLASELDGNDRVNWPLGLSYGTHLRDVKQVELLMPPGQFHHFEAELRLGGGVKTGRLQLFLPVTEPAKRADRGLGKATEPEDWAPRWQAAMGAAEVAFDAQLLRMRLPLARLEALEPGQVLEFDRAALAKVALVDGSGQVPVSGRLGCKTGRRALMLGAGDGASANASASAPMPDMMADAMLNAGGPELGAAPLEALQGEFPAPAFDTDLHQGDEITADFAPQMGEGVGQEEDSFGLNSGPDVAAMMVGALEEGQEL